MKSIAAYFFSALLLLQSFGRELLVVSYALNKASITARYCENKARPQLRCEGKCHLSRQLRKTEGSDQQKPGGALLKVKFEVLPPAAVLSLRAPQPGRPLPRRYATRPGVRYADAPTVGVFRPPLLTV